MNVPRISTAEVTEQFVLSKCDYLVEVQMWALRQKLDPRRWLSNFNVSEKEHAVHLLNAFLYFGEVVIDELFIAAFHGLSRVVIKPESSSYLKIQADWREFFDKAIITHVTGETPSITDSGIAFSRKAKKLLNINEDRILPNEEALLEVIKSPRPVVFVDDFVGSGNQFIETWTRLVELPNSISTSFEQIANLNTNSFFYTPLICTEYGLNNIKAENIDAFVLPAHIISNRYNVFAPDSLIWTPALQPTASEFIKNASSRAGINVNDDPNDWMGFHQLGLTIAFADSAPDATLPLFTWDKNGWHPLIKY